MRASCRPGRPCPCSGEIMPRTLPVYTCALCPQFANLTRSVSCVLHAAHRYVMSVCGARFSLVSQCAGGFLAASNSGTNSSSGYNDAHECPNNLSQNPRRMKPPNDFAEFLHLLASVLSIIVSVLRLLEMTNRH